MDIDVCKARQNLGDREVSHTESLQFAISAIADIKTAFPASLTMIPAWQWH